MQNQITELEIQNFKSIKQLQADCKRINLFIGKPNVGKSNILEAISLLGAPYEREEKRYLSSFIRYEDFRNLFYDQDLENIIDVKTNLGSASLEYYSNDDAYALQIADVLEFNNNTLKQNIQDDRDKFVNTMKPFSYIFEPNFFIINSKGEVKFHGTNEKNPVKKYDFHKLERHENRFTRFLLPPYGINLFTILQKNKSLYKELTPLIKEYGLDLVLKIQEHKFEIQKNLDGIVYSYPYSTIADTLQRVIFYLTAIESNTDSVLLFEEPEAHAFPPYTRMLADRIAHSIQNQFFITTHSPYLLHTIIENTPIEELNVFITYFEDYQTKVKALSSEEIRDVLDDSIDIFFNLDRFVAHEA
jgi:AAA15 family ATPase/GTPase